MKFKKLLILATFGILFASCTTEVTMKEYMVGNWQTKYINLKMPTYQKSDSTFVVENDFSEENVTLAQSIYNEDGTFTAWYLTPKGEKKQTTSGVWSIKKDSLFIVFSVNEVTTKASYYIEKTADGFLGKSANDWDNDGENDDFLLMETKRIKPTK